MPSSRSGVQVRGDDAGWGRARHLFAAYELGEDKLYGHIDPQRNPRPGGMKQSLPRPA
jgi:hypothetical protein